MPVSLAIGLPRTALAACVCVCVCRASVAAAQAPADAARGLFGSEPLSGARRLLDLTVTLSSGRDDDLGAEQGVSSSPRGERIAGGYSDLDALLSVTRKRQHLDFSTRAGSSLRHYPELNSFVGSTYSGVTDVTVTTGRRTTLRANVTGYYVSSFAFETLSSEPAIAPGSRGQDVIGGGGTATSPSLDATRTRYSAMTQVTRTLGKRSSFSVTGTAGLSETRIMADRARRWAASSDYQRQVSRDFLLRVGYVVSDATQQFGRSETRWFTHDVQAGVERQWRHSAFRRTTLSLSGGPSLLSQGNGLGVGPIRPAGRADDPSRLLRGAGTIVLTHDFSRTWSAGGYYRRGSALFESRLSSNAAALDVRGTAGNRVVLTLSAGYTDGELDVTAQRNRDTTSFASGRILVALSRHVAAYGQYLLYFYDFPLPASEAAPYPQQLRRRGLRAGITMWMPLQRGAS